MSTPLEAATECAGELLSGYFKTLSPKHSAPPRTQSRAPPPGVWVVGAAAARPAAGPPGYCRAAGLGSPLHCAPPRPAPHPPSRADARLRFNLAQGPRSMWTASQAAGRRRRRHSSPVTQRRRWRRAADVEAEGAGRTLSIHLAGGPQGQPQPRPAGPFGMPQGCPARCGSLPPANERSAARWDRAPRRAAPPPGPPRWLSTGGESQGQQGQGQGQGQGQPQPQPYLPRRRFRFVTSGRDSRSSAADADADADADGMRCGAKRRLAGSCGRLWGTPRALAGGDGEERGRQAAGRHCWLHLLLQFRARSVLLVRF
ncbi:translation initiation factor IF-2-like [Schistocerca piceifrons]|uniref:translation initiation factor IF-2-like n=1 Tax=Schistocerca piceifrons TaxID=274613 RepID=UPI001F5EA983|nr:translation initiation factor IF-2-like [Schistocerca piceifrons]